MYDITKNTLKKQFGGQILWMQNLSMSTMSFTSPLAILSEST